MKDAGHEWDQGCPVSCQGCNWRGVVHELEEVEAAYNSASTRAKRS